MPEPNASIKRDIPGLAPGVRVEAIRTMIWRAKWKGVLAKKCGLPMKGEPVQIQCSRSVDENVRIDCISSGPIIETQSQSLNGKSEIEPLRASGQILAPRVLITT